MALIVLLVAVVVVDDPETWAAQDKFGKGLTVCQREVDPDFLVGNTSGKHMVLVSVRVIRW